MLETWDLKNVKILVIIQESFQNHGLSENKGRNVHNLAKKWLIFMNMSKASIKSKGIYIYNYITV